MATSSGRSSGQLDCKGDDGEGVDELEHIKRWDFGMLAMSAARNNETEKAIEWLLHPVFEFDDVGMPSGGARVPTPYFPGAGSLLLAIAGMAAGWDGSEGNAPGFPASGWNVRVEGVSKIL